MDQETYNEHVTQWLELRRGMARTAAARLVAANQDYLAGTNERGVDTLRAASYIHALADV